VEDDVVGYVETLREIPNPSDHRGRPIDEVIDHYSGDALSAAEVEQPGKARCQIECPIVHHRQSRRAQHGAGAQDVASFPFDHPLVNLQEMAAATAATVMKHQDRFGAFPPRRAIGSRFHLVPG
jgi:hypothetical protein